MYFEINQVSKKYHIYVNVQINIANEILLFPPRDNLMITWSYQLISIPGDTKYYSPSKMLQEENMAELCHGDYWRLTGPQHGFLVRKGEHLIKFDLITMSLAL